MQNHEQWARRWEWADLESARLGRAYLYGSNSIRDRVAERTGLPMIESPEHLPSDAETLLVAGGGTAIDRAKHFRRMCRPELRLIASPSIWGSGAEVSPIAVLTGQNKEIYFGDDLVTDRYLVWPELARTAPLAILRYACGDVWAHAFEAFCSPIATDSIRARAAELMNEIAMYPAGFDARWFDASAAACLLQAHSSVGLVHGFAHVLEPFLHVADPAGNWGHARLCSTFLLPVLKFNLSRSSRIDDLASRYGLDLATVRTITEMLFTESDYVAAMEVAERHWETVARDRCSRINCVVVRRDALRFFQQFTASGVNA